MASIGDRLKGFLVGIDGAFNALGGGHPHQTISGTVGRACGFGGGEPHWWGPMARKLIDGMPWFGAGHCEGVAEEEARG